MPDRRSVIITFKKKDARSTDADKQEIARSVLSSDVQFFSTELMGRGPGPTPRARVAEDLGYDVNRYEAPILIAPLSDSEIDELRDHPDVERVEEDGTMYALGEPGGMGLGGVPVMPFHGGPPAWPLPPSPAQLAMAGPAPLSETTPPGISQVKAPDAWPTSMGEGMKVLVCDTGIKSDHPDLVANLKEGLSFVPSESSTEDFQGHGTHCAGTIAAALNGIGVVGVAPHAYLYPVKVLSATGSGNWSWLIAALDWVMQQDGCRIASMSLGGDGAPQALGDMCQAAYDDGVLLIAAAGNSGPGNDTVGFPAKYPSVVAVSAVDSTDTIATFSSRGPEVEVCAPGVNVLSTTRNGSYGTMSGTSMACPHVSGVAALAWGSHRGANNKQVRWLLNTFTDRVGDADPEKYGRGRVDANTAAFYIGQPPEFGAE